MSSSMSSWRRLPRSEKVTRVAVLALAVVVAVMAWAVVRGDRRAAAGPAPYIPAVQPEALFWGDSYFNGANGVPRLATYAYLTGVGLGYNTILGGHGGTGFYGHAPAPDRTANYLRQLANPDVFNGIVPAVVVVEGGINDGSAPVGAERANAIKALDVFRGRFPKAKIVVLGPASPTGAITADEGRVIGELRAAAAAEGLPFIDQSGWINLGNVTKIIGSDGTHPSAEGHRILAQHLERALRAYKVTAR